MTRTLPKVFSLFLILALALGTMPMRSAQASPALFDNPTTTVFINEIHYDNTGTDAGEAIEIAGPAGTDLTGWSIVLYNGANGAVYDTDMLSGIILNQQGGYGAVVLAYPVNGIQNGAPDGIALVNGTTVVQFLSYEGTFTAVGGPANGITSTDIGVSESGSGAVGNSLRLTGAGTTYGDFTWAAEAANTFGAVNTDQSFGGVVNTPVTVACGSWLNTYEGNIASRSVSAVDADGTVVSMSIEVSPTPVSGTISLQNFVAAGAPGGTATGDVVVDADVPAGVYGVIVTAANDDTSPQDGTCSFSIDVDPFLTIGEVQGVVEDHDIGTSHSSPYVGEFVAVQGVIYQKTQEYRSAGGAFYGFFLQNTASMSDGDPNSSDGIFVFHDRFSTLLVDGGGTYVPQVGDEVILRGPVQERFNNTRLNNPRLVQVVRSGVDLAAEIPAFEVNPQADVEDDIQDAYRYWERYEGMRGQVPANSIVLDGRDVFLSTFDSEVWVARSDSQIAQRVDPYARRSFRDPHPLDDISAIGFDNGNPYRILMGSFGLKATFDDTTTLLAPTRTYDVLANAPVGGVYFNFGKYSVQVEEQLVLTPGVDPSLNAPPQAFDRGEEFSIAPYNVENLYDFRDDPFDGCDFTGNSGCPGVRPPFDYVPASDVVYQAHLNDIALQIINDLHSPDIIFVQEAEDQDICTVSGTAFTCGSINNADGKPDTLQELTTVIAALGGPAYDAAYDRNGADDRGIVSGFLYRTERVELLPASAFDPVLGSSPAVDYRGTPLAYNTDVQNPKALNADLPSDVDTSTGTDGSDVFTRPPQVGLFRVWRTGIGESTFVDLYAISNHFSSTPDARVGQRTEQALYNAAIVDALQTVNPEALVAVAGDFNVYPRPDDPFEPGHPLFPSDQLAVLYNQGLENLFEVLVAEVPVSAYSYIFQGQTQTLDQIFVTPSLMNELVQARAAHINSDWPADYDGDGPRGASDHDPLVARYTNLPTIDKLEALVQYFADNDMITGNNTLRLLMDRLEKARRFQQNGQQDAYLDQLQAFIDQVYDFTPQFITQEAADALIQDTALLKTLP